MRIAYCSVVQKNYTDDGVWTVSTGEKNISEVGQTQAYNGSTMLPFWSSDYANMVNGSGPYICRVVSLMAIL